MNCLHVDGAVCWLCSNQDPRWLEWRLNAGLTADLPNPPRPVTPVMPSCQDCGGFALGKRCQACHINYLAELRRGRKVTVHQGRRTYAERYARLGVAS